MVGEPIRIGTRRVLHRVGARVGKVPRSSGILAAMASPPKEPALPPEDRGKAYEVVVHGPVFGARLSGAQVEQNALGDCFFLAPLASLAQRRPEEVRAAIQAREDGTFAVRLFHWDPATGALAPREVVVDAQIPEEHGQPIYGTTVHGRGLWVALFEKAFAVERGGYDRIDHGGVARLAVEALTGRPAHTTTLEHAHPDAIWEAIERAIAAHQITLASTLTDEEARALIARRQARGDSLAGARAYDSHTFTHARHGFLAAHEYSLWAISGAGGHRSVTLRNPWAAHEKLGDGKDDGILTLPFDELMLIFADVTLGG
jgi:hypothetical protein